MQWRAAQELAADLDSEGNLRALRESLDADAAYLPAVIRYYQAISFRHDLRTKYLADVRRRSGPFFRCLEAVLQAPTGYLPQAFSDLLHLEQSGEGSGCTAAFLGFIVTELTPVAEWRALGLEYLERAAQAAPSIDDFWMRRAAMLIRQQRHEDARAVVRQGLRHAATAMQRIGLYRTYVTATSRTADSALTPELQRALTAAVERDGRPGVLWSFLDYGRYPSADPRKRTGAEAASLEQLALAVERKSAWHEWAALRRLGSFLTDAGRPLEAVRLLDRAVQIADSSGWPLARLDAYRFRGRAYVKLGKLAPAERDLLTSIAVGSVTRDPYYLSEVHHNLAHVYESMGRLDAADRAVDRFVELTRTLTHTQPHMMSLHDAGIIRWKAGRPAAASEALGEMVRIIDRQDRGHFWAGEFFERSGDLPRALRYYRRGVDLDEERSLNLGGLTRVYRELGHQDSAEAAARMHDSIMSNQLDVPLLPAVLAEAGRRREALDISRRWTTRQEEQGNLHGAAISAADLADLLLRYGDAREALREAGNAERLARRINLTDQLIRARRLAGQSRIVLGDTGGLRQLRSAAALAEAHPTAEATVSTQLGLADALAGSQLFSQSLLAYDRAARGVEAMTERLARDVDRVRFRERQLAPFDGAVDILLRQEAVPRRLALLAEWSDRRKAASLALAAGKAVASRRWPEVSDLAALRGLLPQGSALIDYLTVRGRSAALVVTPRAHRLVSLPLSPDSLRSLADRLRLPLSQAYAGRIDLSRAAFDLHVAHQLYRALLEPVESLLTGVTHLLVVPDGPLHYVPFDALVMTPPAAAGGSGYREPNYAVDRYRIDVLPSSRFLADVQHAPLNESGARVLVVNRDAPGGRAEADQIRAAWPGGAVSVLSEASATETAVRQAESGYAILHFATHAVANDQEPLASHLRLGPDAGNDGFLHLGEIAAEALRSRLVVLSACETVVGRLYHGEGLMGLARAFLAAGAEAVVATQWPVGPATAGLMGEFHRGLARGVDASRALYLAKLELRRAEATAHPFFWAGFVMARGAVARESGT